MPIGLLSKRFATLIQERSQTFRRLFDYSRSAAREALCGGGRGRGIGYLRPTVRAFAMSVVPYRESTNPTIYRPAKDLTAFGGYRHVAFWPITANGDVAFDGEFWRRSGLVVLTPSFVEIDTRSGRCSEQIY